MNSMKPISTFLLSAPLLLCPLNSHAKDFGDAPSSYGTSGADNGPSHESIPTLFMGNLGPDDELDGLPNGAALGDDLDGLDDEDALIGNSLIFLEGESYKLVINCTNQTGNLAELGVWVDWNRDGVFKTDAVEFTSAAVPSAGLAQQIVVTLPTVPIGVVGGNPAGELSFIRLRLTTDIPALNEPTGPAADGEVEDWQIQIFENYDYGDLSDIGPGTGPGNHRTNLADGGPRHRQGHSVYLGKRVDGEFNAQPLASALGDDDDAVLDDEDGVSVSKIVPTLTATFTVIATNETNQRATLRAAVDLNQNGSFTDPGERQSQVVLAGSTTLPVNFEFGIPADFPVGNQLATRFRISTDPLMVDPEQATLSDGEVEDHLFTVDAGRDWGDLPDRCPGHRAGNFDRSGMLPDYRTLAIDNGPSHAIIPGLSIANDSDAPDVNVDPDIDGQANSAADGDDTDGNHDDLLLEYALVQQNFVLHPLGADHSKLNLSILISQAVENITGADATFYAFFDGNRDGDFDDPGERFTTIVPGDGSVLFVTHQFDAVVPWPGVQNWTESFALRCRISSDPNLGPNGPAPDGEVQDDIVSLSMEIDNPRPVVEGQGDFIQLDGGIMTTALNTPFSPRTNALIPDGVGAVQNPIWSLHIDGDVEVGGVINFSAQDINSMGLGAHPITLSFEEVTTGDRYVIRFLLRIVDLPGYSSWATASNLPPRLSRPELDPDLDGLPNLLEFALGSRGDLPGSLPTKLSNGTDDGFLTMTYPRLDGGIITAEGYRVGELLYRREGSTDLANWNSPTSSDANPVPLPLPPVDYHWNTFRLTAPISDNNNGFLRLQIELSCMEH